MKKKINKTFKKQLHESVEITIINI